MTTASKLKTGHKGTLEIASRDSICNQTSTLSERGAFSCIGLNVNHATLPIVRSLIEKSLSEFLPEIWNELQDADICERAVALRVYRAIQRKCRAGL